MTKQILVNAAQQLDELRIAIIEVQKEVKVNQPKYKLIDLFVEHLNKQTKIGNIYKGVITTVEKSLNAAFVDFGQERHGFLPLKEIAREYFNKSDSSLKKLAENKPAEIANASTTSSSSFDPSKIKEGQEVIIQVEKDERGNKGAALTTFISLAGAYLVLMPNNPRAGGISRRIEGEEREELRIIINKLNLPEEMGVIVRTAGANKSYEELEWDLNTLLTHWQTIKQAAENKPAPFLIHQESDPVIRNIRDYLRPDITKVRIDSKIFYEKALNYIKQTRPDLGELFELDENKVSLFTKFQIENQIEQAYQEEIRLPSGGSIVINPTEALVAIDINSARATRGGNIEETALNTNIEAAEEIARQLRLRDLGGLIVIDFIDMTPLKHQREVENHLRNALSIDRARVQMGRISRFGLLEMSRQRLRSSLAEMSQVLCPRCEGRGTIRAIASFSTSIIRVIEEHAIDKKIAQIQAYLPVEVATNLFNEKRDSIKNIENNYKITITIVPDPKLQIPHYRIRVLTQGQADRGYPPSYDLIEEEGTAKKTWREGLKTKAEEPAIKGITPATPAPVSKRETSIENVGLFKRIWSKMLGHDGDGKEDEKPQKEEEKISTKPATEVTKHRRTPTGKTRSDKSSYRGQPKKTSTYPQTKRRTNLRSRRTSRGRQRKTTEGTEERTTHNQIDQIDEGHKNKTFSYPTNRYAVKNKEESEKSSDKKVTHSSDEKEK